MKFIQDRGNFESPDEDEVCRPRELRAGYRKAEKRARKDVGDLKKLESGKKGSRQSGEESFRS